MTKSEYQKWARKNSKDLRNHIIPTMSELDKMIISHVPEGGNYMNVPDSVPSERIKKYKKTRTELAAYIDAISAQVGHTGIKVFDILGKSIATNKVLLGKPKALLNPECRN